MEKKTSEIYQEAPSSLSQNKSAIGLEEYFLALYISRDDIISPVDIPVLPVDFENKQAAHFWKWARDIIKSSRRRQSGQNFKKLLTNLPKELSGFVDTLYLV